MKTHSITIRIAAFGSAEYANLVHLRHVNLRAPLGLEFTSDELALDVTGVHYGAYNGTTAIGCVIAQPLKQGIRVRQMAVESTCRGQGVGKQLMESLESHCLREGIVHFTLHARRESTGFYQKLGYMPHGEEFYEIGLAHQRMDKTL